MNEKTMNSKTNNPNDEALDPRLQSMIAAVDQQAESLEQAQVDEARRSRMEPTSPSRRNTGPPGH